jgi:acyl dehydratase
MIGRVLSTGTATATAEHVAAFARALGDDNPAYRGPGATAPLTYPIAFMTQGMSGGMETFLELGLDFMTLVHGEQEFEYRRPIRVGESLALTSRIADVYEKAGSSGTLDFVVLETQGHGRRRAGGVLLAQHAHLEEDVMALEARQVTVGTALPPLGKGPITREMLKEYGPAAGDPNPIHVDDEFARNAGYPGVFAHGMLSMGFLGEFLVNAAGVGNVRRFRARFAKLTWPGDLVTCKGTVTAVRDEGGVRLVECEVWTETQSGDRKVTGSATLALPLA